MTTQAINSNPNARRLALAIVALLIVAALAGAGWWILARIRQPKEYDLIEVTPPSAIAYDIARQVAQNNANNPNLKQIRGGDFTLNANKNDKGWTLRLNLTRRDLLPPDQAAALLARFRLANDVAFAKSLKITDDQIRQLKEIPTGAGLIVSESDRARIHKAWDAYIANPQLALQQELEKTVQSVGQASLQPTRNALGERAKKIQAILTPEQIAPFKQ